MNTGQMMLTICGLMLLSTIILRMNTSYTNTSISVARNTYDVMAVSLATSYFEEIKRKSYDEKTVTAAVSNTGGFSSSLGRESGEARSTTSNLINANNFDDVDDYDGEDFYTEIPSGTASPPAVYRIRCSVNYYSSTTNMVSTTPQWSKKITVTISSAAMSGPLTLSTIFSYWRFR